MAAVVHSYGGPLLFVWAWLQGEAAVIVGGSLAAQGYWPWWIVWLLATIPATAGHQIYFYLGRRFGDSLLSRLPESTSTAIERARTLVRENDARVMLAMRFAYGTRLPIPIVCGTSGIAPARFFRYNLATALAWALAFTLCGYAVGTAALVALHRVAHYGAWLLGASLAAGFGMHLLLRHRAKRLT